MALQADVWDSHERKHHQSGKHWDSCWKSHSSRIRADLSAPRESAEWTSKKKPKRLVGVTACPRQFDLLDVAFEARLREANRLRLPRRDILDFWVDLSQSVARRPWGNKSRPFKSRAQIYSYEAGRCIDGIDSMRLLGWPRAYLKGLTAGDLLALAGDGSSLSVAALVECVMVSNPFGDWHSNPTQP